MWYLKPDRRFRLIPYTDYKHSACRPWLDCWIWAAGECNQCSGGRCVAADCLTAALHRAPVITVSLDWNHWTPMREIHIFASRQNPKDLFCFFAKSFPSHERSGHDNSTISPCLVASPCASFNSPRAIDTRRCARRPGDYFSHCREAVQPKKMKSVEISQVGFQTLIQVFTFAVVQRPHWQQNRGARCWTPPVRCSTANTVTFFETSFKECHILVSVSLAAITAAEGEIVFLAGWCKLGCFSQM